MPRVNPKILVWARETAGMTLEQAANAIDLKDARGISGPVRLVALEAGETEPSRGQLLKMAQQYRRPLLTFYLAEPPRRGERGQDFRTLPEGHNPAADALLDAVVRDVQARQSMVRSVLEADPDTPRLTFIGSMKQSDGIAEVSNAIIKTLAFDVKEFRAAPTVDKAFAYTREKTESAGIFVLLIGNLGSHHTALDVETFRGFALADTLAPFVVINDQDARSAWSFTLFHELAHLWLGQTGVSGAIGNSGLERFCNDVASRVLLSIEDMGELDFEPDMSTSEIAEVLSSFALEKKVSAALVAYRSFRAGMLDSNRWQEVRNHLRQRWLEDRANLRARGKDSESGPNYYVVRRHRVGPALLSFVRRNLAGGELSTVKAGKVLGVQPKNVGALLADSQRLRRAS